MLFCIDFSYYLSLKDPSCLIFYVKNLLSCCKKMPFNILPFHHNVCYSSWAFFPPPSMLSSVSHHFCDFSFSYYGYYLLNWFCVSLILYKRNLFYPHKWWWSSLSKPHSLYSYFKTGQNSQLLRSFFVEYILSLLDA